MNRRAALGILLIPLLAGAVWYVARNGDDGTPFAHEGNIIKDNPGFAPGIWYLSFDEPGAPGSSVALAFDAGSRCGPDGMLTTCDMSFSEGQRVRIEGLREGDIVHVDTLAYVSASGVPVHLYFYDPAKDMDPSGSIQCSSAGLRPVERVLPHGATVDDVVALLLRGELSDEERALGITTEFPLPGVGLASSTLKDGTLTLAFKDPENKTGGGSCRVSILWAQISETAKQFTGVAEVRFEPEELFQP